MPPKGKKFQRGFVRGVGMTGSGRDRKNRRGKVVSAENVLSPELVANQVKLGRLREEHPELYHCAKRFAYMFYETEEDRVTSMVTYIEKALEEQVV